MIHSLKEIINTGTKEQPVFIIRPQPPKVATDQDKLLQLQERRPEVKDLINRLSLDINF